MKKNQLLPKHLLNAFLFLLPSFCFAQVAQQWISRYNGPANFVDEARSLVVDGWGNVYVSGRTYVSGNDDADYATIKYDANGNELWVKRYNGPGNDIDGANSLAVDGIGNVYVTGISYGSGTVDDYATVKYDANGNELWTARYDGPANGGDQARSLVVDGSGNVYVTGNSYGGGNGIDFATIKYDANGNELWVKRYNGPDNGFDAPSSVAVDGSGNVYVTGNIDGGGSSFDYATIKYDANGNELWVKTYNGPENSIDAASSLAIDASGNAYVTGASIGSGTGVDFATIKYDANGNELWVKRYNGPGNGGDQASSLAVDGSGNVYVAGSSEGIGTATDYAIIKYDAFGNELWVKSYNGTGNSNDFASFLALDASGNVYVTGESGGSGTDIDYATITFNSAGIKQWVERYNGPAGAGSSFDRASSIAVDASGNVYVTGQSSGSGTALDYATIKYSQPPPVSVDAGADQTVYYGYGSNCATLTAQASNGLPPFNYQWSPGSATTQSIIVCPTTTTTYTITVTDDGENTSTDQVTVNVIDVRCGNNLDKVIVCHEGTNRLCIGASAVAAHLAHGDVLGDCSAARPVPSRLNLDLPSIFRVSNYPNPVSATTRIEYQLPFDGQVALKVYDMLGREITTLVNAGRKAGYHNTDFNVSSLLNGVYYYRITVNTEKKVFVQSRKIIVVK